MSFALQLQSRTKLESSTRNLSSDYTSMTLSYSILGIDPTECSFRKPRCKCPDRFAKLHRRLIETETILFKRILWRVVAPCKSQSNGNLAQYVYTADVYLAHFIFVMSLCKVILPAHNTLFFHIRENVSSSTIYSAFVPTCNTLHVISFIDTNGVKNTNSIRVLYGSIFICLRDV